ncbi:MAG: hypothetical protein KGJ41_18110 [Rhodospirillales bacterium]|nr:hypothetical protein [Rhodospirillales bacterium]
MSDENATKQAIEERAAALERRLSDMEALANARVIYAEMKSEAVRAGMVDLDGLKLIDMSRVSLDSEGNVTGASEIMREVRRAKPWLFRSTNSSSSALPPPSEEARQKKATEMSLDEWQAARADLLKRR